MSVGAFLWGSGGRRLSPEDITRERAAASQRMRTDYSPVQSPWQGLARVADNLMGAVQSRRADSASTRNAEDQRRIIEALTNPGGAPAASPGVLPSTGRPMLPNPDGSVSTEESITVTDPRLNAGAPTNIPSIWGGRRTANQNEAIAEALRSGQQFQTFPSIDEAVAAAQARSATLGQEVDSLGAQAASPAPAPARPAINPAIIEALTSPYVGDEVRALAGRQYTEATRRVPPIEINGRLIDPRTLQVLGDYSNQPDIVRIVQASGIDPHSPEGLAMIRRYTENRSDPVVSIPLPNGRTYVGPRSGMPAALRNLGSGAGEPPPATLPPDFDFPEEEGGPQASSSAETFSEEW